MNKINYEIQTLSTEEISLISGGHKKLWKAVGAIIAVAEIPHLFVGLTEFYNKVGARVEHGCTHIDEDDYFSAHACQAVQYVRSLFGGSSTKTEL